MKIRRVYSFSITKKKHIDMMEKIKKEADVNNVTISYLIACALEDRYGKDR